MRKSNKVDVRYKKKKTKNFFFIILAFMCLFREKRKEIKIEKLLF